MFVAAFIGGLVFGTAAKADVAASVELTELAGGLLSLVLWFIFGAVSCSPRSRILIGASRCTRPPVSPWCAWCRSPSPSSAPGRGR